MKDPIPPVPLQICATHGHSLPHVLRNEAYREALRSRLVRHRCRDADPCVPRSGRWADPWGGELCAQYARHCAGQAGHLSLGSGIPLGMYLHVYLDIDKTEPSDWCFMPSDATSSPRWPLP